MLQLVVDGRQLFVGGLKLFFGRLHFFVDALQFLVAGEGLFVRRLKLFESGLFFLDHRFQIGLGGRQFLFPPVVVLPEAFLGGSFRRGARGLGKTGGPFLLDHDAPISFFRQREGDRDHLQGHVPGSAVEFNVQAAFAERGVGRSHFFEGRVQLGLQPFPGHLQEADARLAGGVLKIGRRISAELDDIQVVVHDHSDGGVPIQEGAVRLFLKVRSPGQEISGEGRHRFFFQTFARGGAHREIEVQPRRNPGVLREDPMVAVHHRKIIGGRAHRFRRSQQEPPFRVQREMENGKHFLLQDGVHINQNVAATDQV